MMRPRKRPKTNPRKRRPLSAAARSPLIRCWAELNVVCALLDMSQPDAHFGGGRKGRIKHAHDTVVDVHNMLGLIIGGDARKAAAMVRREDKDRQMRRDWMLATAKRSSAGSSGSRSTKERK